MIAIGHLGKINISVLSTKLLFSRILTFAAYSKTMEENVLPPSGAFKLKPMNTRAAFGDNVTKECDISPEKSVPAEQAVKTELHSEIVVSDRKETKVFEETVSLKEDLNTSSSAHDTEERMEPEVQRVTILPQALLKEVTSMVKQQVVTVPSSNLDQSEKFCLTEDKETDTDPLISGSEEKKITGISSYQGHEDSGILPKTSARKEDVHEESVQAEPEGAVDPFSGLDIDVEVEDKRLTVDETDILPDLATLFSGELEKRRKRALKKAKKKSWKKNGKKKLEPESEKEESDSKKPARPTVNYFVGIQISNPKIQAAIKKVQDSVLSVCEELKPALNRPATLHMTLFVLSINTEEEMLRARQALDIAQKRLQPLYTESLLSLDIAGLGNFRNAVVFAKVKSEAQVSQLQHIAETLEDCFLDQEIVSPDKKGFKPHITVMKLSFLKGRKHKGVKKIDVKLYQDYMEAGFGTQEVDTLQLCSIHKKKDSLGYYQVDHKVNFASSVQNNNSKDDLQNKSPIDNTGKDTDVISVPKDASAECDTDRTDKSDVIADIETENIKEIGNNQNNEFQSVPNVKESKTELGETDSDAASVIDNYVASAKDSTEEIVIDNNTVLLVKNDEELVIDTCAVSDVKDSEGIEVIGNIGATDHDRA